MASKSADVVKLNLRLPKPLHKWLTQQARRNHVSLNTEILNQLSKAKDPGIAAHLQKDIWELEQKIVTDVRVQIGDVIREALAREAPAESERRVQDMPRSPRWPVPEREKGEEKK